MNHVILDQQYFGEYSTASGGYQPFNWIESMGGQLVSSFRAVVELIKEVALLILNFLPSLATNDAGTIAAERAKNILGNLIAIPNGILGFFVPPAAGVLAKSWHETIAYPVIMNYHGSHIGIVRN